MKFLDALSHTYRDLRMQQSFGGNARNPRVSESGTNAPIKSKLQNP